MWKTVLAAQRAVRKRPANLWYNAPGTEKRQIRAKPRQGREAATVGAFLWVFGGATLF